MSVKEKGILAVFLNLTMLPQEELPSPNSDVFLHIQPVANVDLCSPKANCRNVGLEGFANEGYNLRTLEFWKKSAQVLWMFTEQNRLKHGFWTNFYGRFTVSWKQPFFLTWFSFFRTRSFQGFRKRILQGDSTLKASWHAKCFSYIIVLGGFYMFLNWFMSHNVFCST